MKKIFFFIMLANITASATVTAILSNASGKFNWCAYGSDYPPNIGDYIGGTYTLRDTPPFILKDASGATQAVSGATITSSSLTISPITMTDETGCPGYFANMLVVICSWTQHINAIYVLAVQKIGKRG
jgi:hypothetical protein